MLSSVIHQPCEVTLHLLSEDIFIHPPPSNETTGKDQTLRGVVEIKAPSERTIGGVKVTLQGVQTIAMPDSTPGLATNNIRWEEKIILDKSMEILSDGDGGIVKHHRNKGKGKAKERPQGQQQQQQSQYVQLQSHATTTGTDPDTAAGGLPPAYSSASDDVAAQLNGLELEALTAPARHDEGMHLDRGVHGFEFSFIIPASSPPFERCKHGRTRYIVTAIALGAGRAKHNVVATREVFVILNVNKDGGPTPLEITYADVHEALGPISLSLTAASLTVGGTATLTIVHPDPPAKLNVLVIRVFIEQTFELYSELRKAWLKIPAEKMRIAEWGHMPNKSGKAAATTASTDSGDAIWIADDGYGRPGRGAFRSVPHTAPYGPAVAHPSSSSTPNMSPGARPIPLPNGAAASSSRRMHANSPTIPGVGGASNRRGYRLKSTLRLPNDDQMRPSTVRGSRADIRVSHEMGVEVFFSREDVLDTREKSDTFGKPKVQVFSARRNVVIPSCTATFDTVHLPPYVQESPVSSRPPSPTNLARSPINIGGGPQHHHIRPNHSHTDIQKLANTLHNTLPGGRGRATPPSSKPHSNGNSRPGSRAPSRDSSPTRPPIERGASSHSIGHSLSAALGSHFPGRKSRPNSRPSSPTHERPDPTSLSSSPISTSFPSRGRRGFGANHLQAFTPAVATQTNTAPASGTATPIHPHHHQHGFSTPNPVPRTLPPNSPWGVSHLPHRTGNSHDTCNCGRTTEELANAEHRLLEGVPTAPGAFSEHHADGEQPPPWSESRPASPDYFSQVWASTASAAQTPAGHRAKTPFSSPPH
ncbi:hypothetical protein BDZ90DRAFT_231476 [Jaminaea rosea]|uniref:Arrestin-like N-terminal domain-containing protein n=1 Tax=Jaminaea rosea TaxID=1569628 RepID=A0A316UT82_9BASI|nr:hypothetical protein BDZ90DRAFT_231476 [Jaminaea rosea]PWN28490.1 hypothetical protein BDZ90DRAFT_231476 [Jaminaea rosea]